MGTSRVLASGIVAVGLFSAFHFGCSASDSDTGGGFATGSGANGGTGSGATGSGASGGTIIIGTGGTGGTGIGPTTDPKTCAQAAASKSYIGCDFYPTVVPNNVWSIFDYAVVAANAGDEPADVTVMLGADVVATATVPPNGLSKIYLPWITSLKGPDTNTCGAATPVSTSVKFKDAAYHLTATRPITLYQFSALQYQGAGGPPGKDWSSCPGNQVCPDLIIPSPIGCFSFSNDASLLLPSTAMTGTYRITTQSGWAQANLGSYFAVTGTQDGTNVTANISAAGRTQAGLDLPATNGGGSVNFTLDQGEVALLVGTPTADLSGSLVTADKPVQVIAGVPCINQPLDASACDHVEESVFPAETLGNRYFVTTPTGPRNNNPGHIVRLYGNFDGTTLTYPGVQPPGAPTSLNAGQVVELGRVTSDFEVVGSESFAVGSFMLGGSEADPNAGGGSELGDPSQSMSTPVDQYRSKYVFLAPDDYDVSFVDIVMPLTANVTLDGSPLGVAPSPLSSDFGIARVQLGPGIDGAHLLDSDVPVGIQVMGYGAYTSYHYPGGLDLKSISVPPVK